MSSWQSVLCSDESIFTVSGNSRGRVYKSKGSDPMNTKYYIKEIEKFPDKIMEIMVWGYFSSTSVGALAILPENEYVNKNNYLDILCDYLPISFERCRADFLMQDGAPCHSLKKVKQSLCDCQVDFFKD